MNTGMFHSRASSVQRSIMYTASAPRLCGMKAVCSVFQERGGSFSNQMYPRSLRKVVRQLMGRNSLRPLGCGFLGMRDAMTRNHISWKLSEENISCMFLTRHKICSSRNARSISAVTPSGLDLPFFNLAKHCARHHVGRLHSPGSHCPKLQLQFVLSRNSDLKNVCVETSDGRRRRFLNKNSHPVEVIATFPLHWRSFRLACFQQKNHSFLSSNSPSSPPQETIAPSPFNSRRSTLQLRLQIADDLILLAFLTCLVRKCSARQETKKKLTGLASQRQILQSHK